MRTHGPKMEEGETVIGVRIGREPLAQLEAIRERHFIGRPGFAGLLLERALYLYKLGGSQLFWVGSLESGTWDAVADVVSEKLRALEGPPPPDNVVEFPQVAESD